MTTTLGKLTILALTLAISIQQQVPFKNQLPPKNADLVSKDQLTSMLNFLITTTEPLRNRESVENFISGANTVLKIVKDSEDCKQSLNQLGDALFEIIASFRLPKTLSVQALVSMNTLVKLDRIGNDFLIANHFSLECIQGNFNQLRMAFIKSTLFYDVVGQKIANDIFGLGLQVGNLVIQLKVGNTKEAGVAFAKLVQEISKFNVGKMDPELEKVQLISCIPKVIEQMLQNNGTNKTIGILDIAKIREVCF